MTLLRDIGKRQRREGCFSPLHRGARLTSYLCAEELNLLEGYTMDEMYHYTTVDGFHGIIGNKSIRMTKSDYLNDPKDGHLFISLVEKYLLKNSVFENVLANITEFDAAKIVQIKQIYSDKGCSLTNYMKYIHGHVSMYVLSLSESDDDMTMWNYYGRGGMQLTFSVGDLSNSILNSSDADNEYLAEADVIYTDKDSDLRNIPFDNLSRFQLRDRRNQNVFQIHRELLGQESDQLYRTQNLELFIDTYLKSYLLTLNYLLNTAKSINVDTDCKEIYQKVYGNVMRLYGDLLWKRDLSLYMIVLSALIKSNSYKHEKEHRLVYFQYSDLQNNDKEEYTVKHLDAGDFIQPYITFENIDLSNSLKGVKLSPKTRNLPIDDETYKRTLEDFVGKNVSGSNVPINYSDHAIRW